MSLGLTLMYNNLCTAAEISTYFGPVTRPARPRRQMYRINEDAQKWQTGPCSLQPTGRYTLSMSHQERAIVPGDICA